MKDVLSDYENIFSDLSRIDIKEKYKFLEAVLPEKWIEWYQETNPTVTNILQFNDYGFEFLYDCSSELVNKGILSLDESIEDRVVVVYGKSQASSRKRDSSRIRGFLGKSMNEKWNDDTDKGHFIGHALGGGLDVNLFPQSKEINRGLSKRGKVFRAMERYCYKNPGTFCFSRPIYGDYSWRPFMLEYGLLNKAGDLWVERFEN